jgi:hypothetical protein
MYHHYRYNESRSKNNQKVPSQRFSGIQKRSLEVYNYTNMDTKDDPR